MGCNCCSLLPPPLNAIHCPPSCNRLGHISLMRKLSGLQRDVLSLYRSLLREGIKKDRSAATSSPNNTRTATTIPSLLSNDASTTHNVQAQFRKEAGEVARSDFRTIEYLIRKGRKHVKLLQMPGVKSTASFGSSTGTGTNKRSMSTATTSSHYEAHTADSYEQAYFYEPGAYMQHLVDLTGDALHLDTLGLGTSCQLLDIGGGTGNFAQALIDKHPATLKVTVVDPFLDPTASFACDNSKESSLNFVKAPAEAFMETSAESDESQGWKHGYQKVLLKEVAHHFKAEDRVNIFRGMYEGIAPAAGSDSSALLVITRPQVDIDYPLWDEARAVWKANQPSAEEFCSELREAGFVNVAHTIKAYPCQISLKRWQSMVKERFWSTFSNFTDEELVLACEQIEHEYKDRIDDDGVIHFEDRLVFISAQKKIV